MRCVHGCQWTRGCSLPEILVRRVSSISMVSFEDELELPEAGLPLGPRLGVTAEAGQSFLGRSPPPLLSVFSSVLVGTGQFLSSTGFFLILNSMLQKAATQTLCSAPSCPEWGLRMLQSEKQGVTWCLEFVRTTKYNNDFKELSRQLPAAIHAVLRGKGCEPHSGQKCRHCALPSCMNSTEHFQKDCGELLVLCPVFIMTKRFIIG